MEQTGPTLPGEVTRLLQQWSGGDEAALNDVIESTYEELRLAAKRQLQKGSGYTLQPTALVNEVYPRLLAARNTFFKDRKQFLWFAGHLMRQIVIEHVRARMAGKRGGGEAALSFDDELAVPGRKDLDMHTLLALDEAISSLEKLDARQAQILVLRFFAGMQVEEIAEILKVSKTTVKREWSLARRWVAQHIAN
ncbi:MAG: ECF-type sigma factor [Acidobacteriota bacterium]|nr:ECF-type sigma factor [Acidobacteriota bacterium]